MMRKRQPRGSIYVLVVSLAMLVGVIGLGALRAARVQVRIGRSQGDFSIARLCARAGLEIAMYRIQTDPNWRTDLGNGAWYTNVALGQGSYSVTASDPITGDITVASNHPVVLTCTGAKGAAVYQMQVQVQVNQAALSCVNLSMCSSGNVTLQKCVLTSTQPVESNGGFNIDGNSTINAVAEAIGTFGGPGAYAQGTVSLNQGLTLPDPAHVFDYYNANGTTVPLAALLQSNGSQIVVNPSFEANGSGWYVYAPSSGGVTMAQDSSQHQDGLYSLAVSNRASAGDVPAQDLPALSVRNGDTYAVNLPVYANSTGSVQATIVVQASGGAQSFSTPLVKLKSGGGWVNAQGNVTLSWNGTLTKATLTLTCTDNVAKLNIDQISLVDVSLPSSAYVMDRVLLSPSSNPYGAANPNGIYIVNCAGQMVTIGPCRIVGTLVVLGAGSGSVIQGPITWEPATTGYPALLADQAITVNFDSSMALSETTYGINFNPSGTPYPYNGGNFNNTASDGFPSGITGMIYCGGNLTISSAPRITGCVVTAGTTTLKATNVNLTYSNASYVNPPPGFSTSLPALFPVPGTWQRVAH